MCGKAGHAKIIIYESKNDFCKRNLFVKKSYLLNRCVLSANNFCKL